MWVHIKTEYLHSHMPAWETDMPAGDVNLFVEQVFDDGHGHGPGATKVVVEFADRITTITPKPQEKN